MRTELRRAAALLWCCVGPALAQSDDVFVRLPLRIVSVGDAERLVVDRGRRDLVEVGDVVVFTPRQGGTYRAVVVQVDRRTSIVRLEDRSLGAVSGIAGELLLPRSRREAQARRESAPQPEAAPRWTDRDQGWRPGMPLLDRERAVRPDQRELEITGRIWSAGDLVGIGSDRSNSYLRIGTAFDAENVAGRGGALHFDAEINHRTEFDGSGRGEREGLDALVRRLSYSWGGTRFDRDGYEVGRFLQRGMPEFGILDGAEWTGRSDDGDRYGAAVGLLPEPDDDHETGQDVQFAAHYLWAFDPAERFVAGIGLQKTLHDKQSDRDLLVAKLRYVPDEQGWDLFATGWIDFYFGDDQFKEGAVELTQAFVSSGRSFDDGTRIDVAWRRQRFPELDRQGEFLPVIAGQYEADRYDRLTVDLATPWGDATRPFLRLAAWSDEDDEGIAGDLGVELREVLFDGDRLDLTAVGNHGEFGSYWGGRVGYGVATRTGRWDLVYEYTFSRFEGFGSDRDDLATHRVRFSDSFRIGDSVDVSFHAGAAVWDEDTAWQVGGFLQWTF